MGIIKKALFGVSKSEVDEYVNLRKSEDKGTLTGQQARRLDRLENSSHPKVRLPRGVIREIERKHL